MSSVYVPNSKSVVHFVLVDFGGGSSCCCCQTNFGFKKLFRLYETWPPTLLRTLQKVCGGGGGC